MNEQHIEDIISALYDMIQDARALPLGADKCILERDKVLEMLDEIIAQLPAEIKQSRTIVESRNELIGQARREGIPPNQLKGLIKKVHKLAPDTTYGKISPPLADAWGALRNKLNSDERKAAREAKRAKDKEKKAAKRDKRRAEETIEID